MSELQAIVANPDHVFTVEAFDDLLQNVDLIVGLACTAPPGEQFFFKSKVKVVL